MVTELVHVGFGNILSINRVIAIISPNSAPTKRMIQESKNKGTLIDMTNGKKTRAVLITDCGQIVLAAISPETLASRLVSSRGSPNPLGEVREAKGEK